MCLSPCQVPWRCCACIPLIYRIILLILWAQMWTTIIQIVIYDFRHYLKSQLDLWSWRGKQMNLNICWWSSTNSSLSRLPYSHHSIPSDIIDMLHYTPVCRCGRICFNSEVHKCAARIQLNCSSITSNRSVVCTDFVYCSAKCQNIRRT